MEEHHLFFFLHDEFGLLKDSFPLKGYEQAWLEMGQVAFFIQQGRPFLLLLISCSFFSWVMFSRNVQKVNMDVKKITMKEYGVKYEIMG